ncbi:MAG: glycosyltransferase family 2 protein, partial [Candidatus Hodarchaeota archaeon]
MIQNVPNVRIKAEDLALSIKKPWTSDLFVLIPARNEERSIKTLIEEIRAKVTKKVLVIDNASTDRTAEFAEIAGAKVIHEKRKGYGSACLAGIRYFSLLPNPPEYICFFDGDGQSLVEDIPKVARVVLFGKKKYSQGTRMKDCNSKNCLDSLAQIANRFFGVALSFIWRQPVTDLGPLRCMKYSVLSSLNMKSLGYGWTIEMSAKILKMGISHYE